MNDLLGIMVVFRQKGTLLSIRQAGSIWFCGIAGLKVILAIIHRQAPREMNNRELNPSFG